MKPKNIIIYFARTKPNSSMEAILKVYPYARRHYHFVVWKDGFIEEGIDIEEEAHIPFFSDKEHIDICLIGGRDEYGFETDTRTPEQNESLFNLISFLILKYDFNSDNIHLASEADFELIIKGFTRECLLDEYETWLREDLMKK